MPILVTDPDLESRLKAERHEANSDGHDEVWEGLYIIAPLANNAHQIIQGKMVAVLQEVVGWDSPAQVCPGANLSDREDDWTQNYRDPDVSVFLPGNPAQNRDTHWLGGPDFLVEIISPRDRAREKLEFYAKVGVREALYIDREPWALELYQLAADRSHMRLVASISVGGAECVSSVLPLKFRLVAAHPSPKIEITMQAVAGGASDTGRRWIV
jgi:Uma2 family endonuclease